MLKGKKYEECNRTACKCQGSEVRWIHESRLAYYCTRCATMIMQDYMNLGLLVDSDVPKVEPVFIEVRNRTPDEKGEYQNKQLEVVKQLEHNFESSNWKYPAPCIVKEFGVRFKVRWHGELHVYIRGESEYKV